MRNSLISLAALAALVSSAGAQPDLGKARQEQCAAGDSRVCTKRTGPAEPSDAAHKAMLAQAQAKLAWEMIEKLGGRGDTTVSPASVASAFGIMTLGASTEMKSGIVKALGFDGSSVDKSVEALNAVRRSLSGSEGPFRSASKLVFAPANAPGEILRAGLDKLQIDYAIEDLGKAEAAARIDAWVKDVTQGAIPEILGGPIDKASFVALNALHFKGRWKTPFDAQLTAPAPFKGIDGRSENVSMMRLDLGPRAFRQERGFIGIDLPFADERFSLVVVTTADKPAAVKDFAKVSDWLSGAGFAERRGDLALPRFSASGRADLLPVLDALGLDKPRRSATALQGLAPGATLSQVVQRATLDVDEEGAEAAAATAVMGTRALESDDGIHMTVDKPFIFALRDRSSGLILVAGYVGHPPKKA